MSQPEGDDRRQQCGLARGEGPKTAKRAVGEWNARVLSVMTAQWWKLFQVSRAKTTRARSTARSIAAVRGAVLDGAYADVECGNDAPLAVAVNGAVGRAGDIEAVTQIHVAASDADDR
ncbi:MAG: hypothetical protein ACJ8BC_04755 [Gemmatimonadales bacterium]